MKFEQRLSAESTLEQKAKGATQAHFSPELQRRIDWLKDTADEFEQLVKEESTDLSV